MNVRWKSQFKKDYKRMAKQNKNLDELDYIIEELAVPNPLNQKYNDHSLKGAYKDYRECHIQPDWLLIYGYETLNNNEKQLLLVRTGSHADLFE